ncbi:phosphoglycerate mutase [Acetobacter orientalis NRIC 0481]|nr:phosphoglycerate mutase [Acetobacter orientalis NRIC 0481]
MPQEALARYVREEDFAPPEGETGHQFQARISTWLLQATLHGCTLVVARPPVVRALAVHALGGQSTLTHHLDSEPETATILTHHAGHWRVRQYGARV